jgi:CDP-glucose 4,6-dehydratase
MVSSGFWQGRRVLVTGHTGFKGSWLCLWLQKMGAVVHGYSLAPPTTPSLFAVAQVGAGMSGDIADVRDLASLTTALAAFRPEIVLHLAAQALVRLSYEQSAETFATNVMGTVNLLEAVRRCDSVQATVIVTSDKCYHNREVNHAYGEGDPMGGHDPYSASKGCAELVAAAYGRSFFAVAEHGHLASARAGNVIGGGDWARDRLLPDLMQSLAKGDVPVIRSPRAVRPWQHVLEPLAGYLVLAQALAEGRLARWGEGWNFGPDPVDERRVGEVADTVCRLWGDGARVEIRENPDAPHEASLLTLNSTKARQQLGWAPRWSLNQALEQTVRWYQSYGGGAEMRAVCLDQIADYAATSPSTDKGTGCDD